MHGATIQNAELRDFAFADRALALRQRAGLTQRELAARLGVTYKAIGAWEGGLSYPGAERLKQLIALYMERGTLLANREEEEATALWEARRATVRRRTVPFDPHWFAALHGAVSPAPRSAPPAVAVVPPALAPPADGAVAVAAPPAARHDWGEAPDVPEVQGRAQELATLERWVQQERCRLVLLLGEGGVGKTTLAARLAHDLAPAFAAVYWRRLRHAPPPEEWLAGAIAALSAAQIIPPDGVEARLGRLLELLRSQRALLVLDNLETVLEPRVAEVSYRPGYEGYGAILRRLGASAHQGCLLVTSREQPLREDRTAVRALHLQGLGVDEGRALLRHRDLAGDAAAWGALVARYAGNPLALQVAGETIGTVFGGDIAAFLDQGVVVFGEIRELLEEQVSRLSVSEHAVLIRLAEERRPVRFAELVPHLCPIVARTAVVESVEALARRTLLERRDGGTFTLHPAVLQYVTVQSDECASAAGQVGTADGVGHGGGAVQPDACAHAPARWDVTWPGASATAPEAGLRGQSPRAARRSARLQAPRRFGRPGQRRAAS